MPSPRLATFGLVAGTPAASCNLRGNEPMASSDNHTAGPRSAEQDELDAAARPGAPIRYAIRYESQLEANADPETYSRYLDAHHEWFLRCAAPMEVRALDGHSYAITIGRFGAFDYYVEPKIGLRLMSKEGDVYWTHSVPVPGYSHPNYDVDFRSSMELIEVPARGEKGVTTKVEWTLNLAVDVWFPRFVRVLPEKLLQTTGDRMLGRIVRQVSKRFTEKVQRDFHEALGLPLVEPRELGAEEAAP